MFNLINSISITLVAIAVIILCVVGRKLQKKVALHSQIIDVTTLILQTLLKAARKEKQTETEKEGEDNGSEDNK